MGDTYRSERMLQAEIECSAFCMNGEGVDLDERLAGEIEVDCLAADNASANWEWISQEPTMAEYLPAESTSFNGERMEQNGESRNFEDLAAEITSFDSKRTAKWTCASSSDAARVQTY